MGWYAKDDNDLSKLTYEDYELNGRYCQSGLAFPIDKNTGNCSAIDHITYGNINYTTGPYWCNASDQSAKCILAYNASYPDDA